MVARVRSEGTDYKWEKFYGYEISEQEYINSEMILVSDSDSISDDDAISEPLQVSPDLFRDKNRKLLPVLCITNPRISVAGQIKSAAVPHRPAPSQRSSQPLFCMATPLDSK